MQQRQGGAEHQNTSDWDNQNHYLNESLLQILDQVSNVTSKANDFEINSNNETRGANIQPKDIISSSRSWVVYVLTPICFIIGVLCNAVSIKIFAKMSMRSSTNVYLTALALSDLLYHVFSFTMSWKYYHIVRTILVYWWYIPFGFWVTEALQSTSVWIIVALTTERCIAVFNPLKRQIYCTEKLAVHVSRTTLLVCFAFTGIFSYDWRATIEPTEGILLNETVYTLETTEAWKEERFQKTFHWISTIYIFLLPAILLVIFTYFLVKFVQNPGEVRQIMEGHRTFAVSQRQINENRVTITVISVGVLYIICQLPTNLLIAYKLVYKPTARSPGEMILLELRSIFNLLSGINSTCTVLLFIALNQNYRKYFCGIFYRRRPTNFYANAFRSPRVGLRVGLHAADGAIELNNIVDGRY